MKNLSLEKKVQLGLLIPIILACPIILQLLYFNMKEFVTNEVKQGLKGQIEIMYGPMVDKYKLLKIGVIKEKKIAYGEAKRIVHELKFGENKKGYFWLFGQEEKKVLAHPLGSFHNQSSTIIKDEKGKAIVDEIANRIKNGESEGFYFYKGVDVANPKNFVNKVAFYKHFKEWNWILGTELNLDTIYSKALTEVTKFGLYIIIVMAIVFAITTFTLKKAAIGPLKYVISKLEDTTKSVRTNSEGVRGSSEKMSLATTEQSSNLQQTVTAVDEISAMVERNNMSAQESRKIGGESQESANLGLRNINSMVGAMHKISKTNEVTSSKMNDSVDRINEILDVVKQIGAKTEVINDIVFQTKLLSFNASVEAARAGEAGKGFAVVAEEVGNLASMSGKASEEISELLGSSISKVEETVDHINRTTKEILDNSTQATTEAQKNANECKSSFDSIMSNVTKLNQRVDEIAKASNEQNAGVSEISDAMRRLGTITQENNSVVVKTEEASKVLTSESDKLEHVVGSIIKIVKGS